MLFRTFFFYSPIMFTIVCILCFRAAHRYSGVLSAYGLALADVVEEVQEPCSLKYEQQYFSELDRRMEQLCRRCRDTLSARGFSRSEATKTYHEAESLIG